MAKQGAPTVRARGLAVLLASVLATAILALAGCGSSNTETVTETVSEETTTTIEGAASNGEPVVPVDGSATSGGIEVTVNQAFSKPTISYEGGTESRVTPDGEPRTIQAPQGGHYIYVVADVLNETAEGIDLTCGYPMKVKLRDADHKRYDPVEGLDLVNGNPECNEQLQPGFSRKMIWIFLVPPSADVEALEFSDVTNFNKEQPAAAISLPSV